MANNKIATQAGHYTLVSMKILSGDEDTVTLLNEIELNQICTHWQISESLHTPNIIGSCTITDAEGILRKLPIRGEERLLIKYRDFFGDESTKEFFVFGVRSVGPHENSSDSLLSYKLDFTTREHLNATGVEVSQSFANMLISDMVKSVFNTYFVGENNATDKEIEVEDTVGNQTFAIPMMSPHDTMMFLAKRAYGGEDSSNSYRFFETREQFFFCTYEYLVKKYETMTATKATLDDNNLIFFTTKSVDDNTPDGQLISQQTVSNISYGNPSDTLTEIKQGQYKRSVLEIDLLNKTTERTYYEYKDHTDTNILDNIAIHHSESFLRDKMPSVSKSLVLKDYNVPGQSVGVNRLYPFYREVINSRKTFTGHMSKYEIRCTISGRIGLVPGMVIFLMVDLIEVGSGNSIDVQRNGLYLVTDITNMFIEDEYIQAVTLSKGGLSDTNDRTLFEENI